MPTHCPDESDETLIDRSHIDEYTVALARPTDAPAGPTEGPADVVNGGASTWPVIVDSRPAANLAAMSASAAPAQVGATPAMVVGLSPNRVQWRLRRVDRSGETMVDAAIRLHWMFGAQHRGCGAYISRAWIEVPDCAVDRSVRLDLTAHALRARNIGSDSAPVAGLPIEVVGSIVTQFGAEHVDWRLAIRGDGSTTGWTSSG